MDKNTLFGREMERVGAALSDIFSGRVLAWQLGGTLVAGLCFAVLTAARPDSGAVAFVLHAAGFILAYVILCATGVVVARLLDAPAEGGSEEGVAPLHFLIDNIGAATLLPLAAAAAAVLAAMLGCLYAWPWSTTAGQGIMVFFTPVMFALALAVVVGLFALLFIIPSMVATEQPQAADAFRRLVRLMWRRRWAIVRVFGMGLVAAVVILIPVLFAVAAAGALCAWVYETASGEVMSELAGFVLYVFRTMLIGAPILAVPLAFLNALSLRAYGELVEDLDDEAEEDTSEDDGEVPNAGEEADLKVEGEEPPEHADEPQS